MIFRESYTADDIPFDKPQALRYFGYSDEAAVPTEVMTVFDKCAKEAVAAASYRVCFGEFPVTQTGEVLDLGLTVTNSKSLAANLCGCEKTVAFAATVGIEIDRLINRYENIYPLKAYAFQAVGAERVESLCNFFCDKIAERKATEGLFTRPRFSCGYGDFPLEKQRDFFAALDCGRKIGLTLNDGMLMSPSKSVTALIGLSREPSKKEFSCKNCNRYESCGFHR